MLAANFLKSIFAFLYILVAVATFAAEPKLETVTPYVIRMGESREFRLIGDGLNSLTDVVFYHPSLVCTDIQIDNDFEATVTFHADATSDVEVIPFRVLTGSGFSNLKTMRLVREPLIFESARQDPGAVIPLPEKTGIALFGSLERGEFDRYAVDLKSGERCTAIVEAMRLGGTFLDTVLKVYDPDGKLIADVDDTALTRQDPYLTFMAEEDGIYTVEVHESNYDGSEDSHYLLFVGTFPAPAILFPPGAEAGKIFDAIAIPESTDTGRVTKLQVGPLASRADGWSSHRLQMNEQMAPAAVSLRSGEFPNVLESSANESRESVIGHSHPVPAAFCGIIDQPGDIDFFAFDVQSGEELLFEVFADRIGSPIDSLLTLYNDDGTVLMRGDDWISHDSRFQYRFIRGGTYYLAIRDKLNNGWPYGVYRIEVKATKPFVETFLPRPDRTSQSGQTVAIPRGNRTLLKLAVRRESVEGDARVSFENLPSGVIIPEGTVPKDHFWVPIIAAADENAKVQGTLLDVHVAIETPNDQVTGGFKQVIDLVSGSADSLFHGVQVDRLAVAVVDPVPFKVNLDLPPFGLPLGGTVGLKIRIERAPGFNDPVILKFPHMPPWSTCDPEATIPRGEDEVVHVLSITDRGTISRWPFVVTGEIDTRNATPENGGLHGRIVASELLDLKIVDAPLVGEIQPIAGEQGEMIEVACRLSRLGTAAGNLTATLEGLPNRVSCEPVTLSEDESTFRFMLHLHSDAPVGTFGSIACRLSGEIDGYPVTYVVADKILLQIEQPGKLVRGASGKLLSPFEALKQHRSDN